MSGSLGSELAEVLRKMAGDLEAAGEVVGGDHRLPYVAPRVSGADEATADLYRGCVHRPCGTCAAACYVPPDIAELVDAGRVEVVCYMCNDGGVFDLPGMFDDYGPLVFFRGIGC